MGWSLTGEYFEVCSCDVLCPCITSSMLGPADYERCHVPLICHVTRGEKDGIALDDLSFVLVIDSPAVMADGGWRVALYVDERADDEQRAALGEILSGGAGGPPEALGGLIGEMLGVKYVPILFESVNGNRRAEIPGILEFEAEPLRNPETGEVLEITGTIHPMGSNLPIARGVKARFDDPEFGLAFDNEGKNGHIREFAWAA